MGKLILLILIIFALYWAWKLYMKNAGDVVILDIHPDKAKDNATVDDLMNYFNGKIKEIESKSLKETKHAEEKLEYYKEELNKLKKIKEQIK